MRGLDSAHQGVRRGGKTRSPKQNRIQGSSSPLISGQENSKRGTVVIAAKHVHCAVYNMLYEP